MRKIVTAWILFIFAALPVLAEEAHPEGGVIKLVEGEQYNEKGNSTVHGEPSDPNLADPAKDREAMFSYRFNYQDATIQAKSEKHPYFGNVATFLQEIIGSHGKRWESLSWQYCSPRPPDYTHCVKHTYEHVVITTYYNRVDKKWHQTVETNK